MDRGKDFLRAQVSNGVMQHKTLLDNLEHHEEQGQDRRYTELCQRWLPRAQEYQRKLEQYRDSLGEDSGSGLKKALGAALGFARDTVEAMRESDFLRLVGDIVTIRQAQDTAAAYAAAGDQIGEPRLAEIGRQGEQLHDEMQRDFNRLVQQLFVEHARATS